MDSAEFIKLIGPGMLVLDGGAGDLRWSRRILERGATVVAVDVRSPGIVPDGIEFIQSPLETYIPNRTFDAIFLRNVIQFCDKTSVLEVILPRLIASLNTDGLMYIRTFYDDPEPPFDEPIPSRYVPYDFEGLGEEVHRFQGEVRAPDFVGGEKNFRIVDFVVRKTAR